MVTHNSIFNFFLSCKTLSNQFHHWAETGKVVFPTERCVISLAWWYIKCEIDVMAHGGRCVGCYVGDGEIFSLVERYSGSATKVEHSGRATKVNLFDIYNFMMILLKITV